jgi:hypothetical protein
VGLMGRARAWATAGWQRLRAAGVAVQAAAQQWAQPRPVAAAATVSSSDAALNTSHVAEPDPVDWGAVYEAELSKLPMPATLAAGGVLVAPLQRSKLRHAGSTKSLRRLLVLLLLLLAGLVMGLPVVAAGKPPRGQKGVLGASFRWPRC